MINTREPVRRHAMYCMVRDLLHQMGIKIATRGNTTIGGHTGFYTWQTNGLKFEAIARRGYEEKWTWGILEMAVVGIENCVYRARNYNAINFLIDIDNVGVVGAGLLTNMSLESV